MYVCIIMEIQADMHRKRQKELATIELKWWNYEVIFNLTQLFYVTQFF